jgi:hypothetical protein
MKWAGQVAFMSKELQRTQDSTNIPGLWPKFFDGSCEDGICDLRKGETQWFTMGSGTDSTYEYLPKVSNDSDFKHSP